MSLFKNKKRNKMVKSDDAVSKSPYIIFNDLKLQITIGQWLGVLKSLKSQSLTSTSIDIEDLMKEVGVSKKDLVLIAHEFAALLKGIVEDINETYVFSDFNEKDLTFKCHLEKANRDVNMSIKFGSVIDGFPKLTIDTEKNSKVYEYYGKYDDKPARLTLHCYNLKNPNNGNELYRYLSPFSLNYTLTSGNYDLTINIDNPEEGSLNGVGSYVYRLTKEQELEQYLLDLSLPNDIFEVYHKIRELDTIPFVRHLEFVIKASKKLDKENIKTTDIVSFEEGKLKKLTKTYKDKTISVSEVSWSYETPSLVVAEQDGKYILTLNSEDDLKNLKPVTDFESVKQEVEQIRVLARTLEN